MSRVAFILLVGYSLAEAVTPLTLTLATDIPETSVPAAPTPAPLPVEWPLVRDGPRFKINGTKYQQVKPAVAALRYGGFVVAYQSLQDVFACRFDASGNQVGSEIQLNVYTSGDQETVRVSGLATGGFVATWISRYQAGGLQDVVGRTFLSTGANSSGEFIVTKTSQKDHHVIGLSGGDFVVTWTEASGGLRSNVYSPKGQPVHKLPFTVDQRAKMNQGLVALQSGGFMCVYTSTSASQSTDTLEATAYDSSLVGTAHTLIMSLPVSTAYEFAVASGPDGVVVVSVGAEMSTMQGSLFDTTGNMKARFNYTVGGDMLKYWQPSLSSFPSGGFLLTWRAGKAANESGIYYTWHVYGQVFGSDGRAVGQPSFLNYASAATGSFVTATSRVNGCGESEMCNRVAVVYDSDRLGGIHIYGQLYNSLLLPTPAPPTPAPPTDAPPTDAPATDIPETSVPAAPTPAPLPVEWPLVRDGPRFKINGTKYQQVKPAVAALRYGGFVVAYQSLQDVFACRFDASGNQVGSEIQLNVYTSGDQETVRVSGLATGGFVATWISRYQAGGLQDVVGRTFLSTGANSSGEFIVTKTSQKDHHVIGLSGGDFVVTWTEASGGLRSNVYSPKGQPVHKLPFTVDQRAKMNQGLVALQSGGFMCVYTSTSASQSTDTLEATAYDSSLVGTAHTLIMSLPVSTAYEFAVASGPDGVVVVSVGAEMSTMQGSLFDTTGNMKARFNYTVGGDMLKYWQPSLSSFPSGGFLLTWRAGKAANESGIYYTWHVYGQVFGSDGRAVGQPSFLNYASAATGSFVTATSRVNGCGESEMCNRVAVVYDSDRLGGIHIYGQLYNSLLLPTPAPPTPAPPTDAPPTDAPATDIPETSVPAAPPTTAPATDVPATSAPRTPPTGVPDTAAPPSLVPASSHWPYTAAPSSHWPYTDAPSQSPSAHWPFTSSPSSHWPYTDAPTHSPSAHWPYTDAPSSHWPYTDAPTHSPSSHWPYTDAPSSHWPYTDAPSQSPSAHWPFTSSPPSHWPYTDAPTHSPSSHWPYTDAPSQSPSAHWPFTSSPPSHWPYTDAPTHSPSSHWPYTDAPTRSPSSHWPYTDAPTHSPSSHWPYTDAPSQSPSAHWPFTSSPPSHWPYTDAPTHSPSSHWPYTDAPTRSPSSHWPYTDAPTHSPSSHWPYTDAPSQSPSAHWPFTSSPPSHWPYTDAPTHSPSSHWPYTDAPSSHWPYTDAPTHSPSAHWPYTDAPSSHWPYTDAPTHSPSSHWPYTDAPSSHWPYTDAPTRSPSSHWPYTSSPSSHWPYTDAPTHSPSSHWPYTDAPSSHWPYTDAPSSHWPYTPSPEQSSSAPSAPFPTTRPLPPYESPVPSPSGPPHSAPAAPTTASGTVVLEDFVIVILVLLGLCLFAGGIFIGVNRGRTRQPVPVFGDEISSRLYEPPHVQMTEEELADVPEIAE